MVYSVPIMITTFLRYEEVSELLNVLSFVKPTKLFITSDGPRDHEERLRIIKVRELLDNIPWECEVHRLYHDSNLGIHKNVELAFEYAFNLVDRLIFMEDDVLPSIYFFDFVAKMLDFYELDINVKMVNGHNMATFIENDKGGYFLSKRTSSSCNALWKRTYEEAMLIKSNFIHYENNFDYSAIQNKHTRIHLRKLFSKQIESSIFSLEILFIFLLYSSKGYNVVSNTNLVQLRGNDEFGANSPKSNLLLPKKIRQLYSSPVIESFEFEPSHLAKHNETYDDYLSLLFAEGRTVRKFMYSLEIIYNYIIQNEYKILIIKAKKKISKFISNKVGKND
jgi:hypothetical protein